MKFHLDWKAIFIYVSTLSAALLSVADVLPLSWLPFIIVAGKIADSMTPRAAKRRPRTILPPAGRGQSGRIRLPLLLFLLALCLSLPFALTGCPKPKDGAQNSNAPQTSGGEQDAAAQMRKRADRATKVLAETASGIEATGDVARELHAGGLLDDDGAREIADGALEGNTITAEAVEAALSYGSLDEFARAGLVTHLDKLRTALSNLNASGALHIKNPKRRAAFSMLLVASGLVLDRLKPDLEEEFPPGVSTPLDVEMRRRLERARDRLKRNDKKLRDDLTRLALPTPTPAAPL